MWLSGMAGAAADCTLPYLLNYLKTIFVRDDAGVRTLSGLPGDIMSGLSFGIAGGDGADNQSWPDEIALADPDHASQILAYTSDGSGGQQVGLCLPYRAVMLPFGFEAIDSDSLRREVMRRAIDFLSGRLSPQVWTCRFRRPRCRSACPAVWSRLQLASATPAKAAACFLRSQPDRSEMAGYRHPLSAHAIALYLSPGDGHGECPNRPGPQREPGFCPLRRGCLAGCFGPGRDIYRQDTRSAVGSGRSSMV